MLKRFFTALIVSYLFVSSQSFSLPKTKKAAQKKVLIETNAEPITKFKLNSQFGVNFISGSAITSGFQLGRRPSDSKDVYLGPEINFMMFSSGSILNLMVGGWIENHFFTEARKTLDLGVSLGAAFANRRPNLKVTSFVGLLDLTYTQQMDEKLGLRAQLRAGFIGNSLVSSVNFNAQFRFP